MQMTNVEIRKMYRESKNKKDQVKILADLNDCTVEEIKEILSETPRLNAEKVDFTKKEETKSVKVAKVPRKADSNKEENLNNKDFDKAAVSTMRNFTSEVKDTLVEELDRLEDIIKMYESIQIMAQKDKEKAEKRYKEISEFLKGAKVC